MLRPGTGANDVYIPPPIPPVPAGAATSDNRELTGA